MLKIKSIFCMIGVFTLLLTSPSYALDNIGLFVPNEQKVGQGRFTYLFWDVYDATLYAPQGVWDNNKPFALTLSYLQPLKGEKIADRSIKEIRDLGFTDEAKLSTWRIQMRQIFPDVNKGITLTGIYTDAGDTIFYKNNVEIGRVKDPEFSKAFFGIWLNEKTSAPDLRQKLLGAI